MAALAPHLSRNSLEFRELADKATGLLANGADAAEMAELLGYDESQVRTVCLLRMPPRSNG